MNQLLKEYLKKDFLEDGNPELMEKIRPAFVQLVIRLEELGENSSEEKRLTAFSQAIFYINRYEDDIETVERETILEAIYDIGAIVGLDPESDFAEEWRGDW